MTRRKRKRTARTKTKTARRALTVVSPVVSDEREEPVGLLRDLLNHTETGPPLSGGDVDADWRRAYSSGEEAVGGSVATPDQDVVDEIGRALGVEQAPDAEVRVSQDILRERDRDYWRLERRAAREEAP